MQVADAAAAVGVYRIIAAVWNAGRIVGIFFLIVVTVGKIVVAVGRCDSGRRLEPSPAIVNPQEAVPGIEGAGAQHCIDIKSAGGAGGCFEQHCPTQPTTGSCQRRTAVKQRGAVGKIRRDQAEVGHAQHGRVNLHAVPRDLCV